RTHRAPRSRAARGGRAREAACGVSGARGRGARAALSANRWPGSCNGAGRWIRARLRGARPCAVSQRPRSRAGLCFLPCSRPPSPPAAASTTATIITAIGTAGTTAIIAIGTAATTVAAGASGTAAATTRIAGGAASDTEPRHADTRNGPHRHLGLALSRLARRLLSAPAPAARRARLRSADLFLDRDQRLVL